MLVLAILACEHSSLTFVGGGSASITLSGLDGPSELGFEVPGMSDDELDVLFVDGHHPEDVFGQLNNHVLYEPEFQTAIILEDPENGSNLMVIVNTLVGFEPCELPLTHAFVSVSLTDASYVSVSIDDRPALQQQVTSRLSFREMKDWNVDEEYGGSANIDVEVACPDGPTSGLLQVEWALDAKVKRRAHQTGWQEPDLCMFC